MARYKANDLISRPPHTGKITHRTRGWYEDSGLVTDKSALPVTQIRLGDLDRSDEEGYYTLGIL